MSWRPKSADELTSEGSGSWLSEVFGMMRQYSTIMSNIEDAAYTKQIRRESKTKYQITAMAQTGEALSNAIKSGDRKLTSTLANQMKEYSTKIPDDGREATRQIANTYLAMADDSLDDLKTLDAFDVNMSTWTQRGGAFDYDYFAGAKDKEEFVARYDDGMKKIEDQRTILRDAGIANLDSYNDILTDEEAMLNKIKQVAGYNLDLPIAEDSFERKLITNARTGVGIQEPEALYKTYKDDQDRTIASFENTQTEIERLTLLAEAYKDDPKISEEDLIKKNDAIDKLIKAQDAEATDHRERLNELGKILTNKRTFDWYGLGDRTQTTTDVSMLSEVEKKIMASQIGDIQTMINTPGFTSTFSAIKGVDADGFLLDDAGEKYNPAQVLELQGQIQKEFDAFSTKKNKDETEEIEQTSLKNYGEEANTVRKKYKLPHEHPRHGTPSYKGQLEVLAEREKQWENASKKKNEAVQAFEQIQKAEENIKLNKEIMQKEKDPKAKQEMSRVISAENAEILRLKKKYGTMRAKGPGKWAKIDHFLTEKELKQYDKEVAQEQANLTAWVERIKKTL